jgi:hypothetical protein|tara:strand:+ start:107 stop:211 length:105 start_codon:yes stop_codon:yes gene_type:complete
MSKPERDIDAILEAEAKADFGVLKNVLLRKAFGF